MDIEKVDESQNHTWLTHSIVNTLENYTGGKIHTNRESWCKISSDAWIRQVVNGKCVEFEELPDQKYIPYELCLSEEDQAALDLALTEFEQVRIIEHCDDESEKAFYSTVFPTIKSDGSARVILNLKSLNQSVEHKHFKMTTIKDAVSMMRKNCRFVVIDFKHAYFSVLIHPDLRKFFRFLWHGRHFQFRCLPQGYSAAPRIFTKLMKSVYAMFRERGIMIQGYIDDSLHVCYDTDNMTSEIDFVVKTFDDLGLTIHPQKSVFVPTQKVEYLGFVLNSQNMTVAITQKKKQKIAEMAHKLLQKTQVSLREFASFIGNLVATTPGVEYAPLRYKPLEIVKNKALKRAKGDYDGIVYLDGETKRHIQWWYDNVHDTVKQVDIPEVSLVLESDASGTGWGGVCGSHSTGGHWSEEEQDHHINWLELLAAFLTLQTFCRDRRDIHVRMMIDNTTAVACLNKMGSTKTALMSLTSEVYDWLIDRNIRVSATHIPGIKNVKADKASREINVDTEWMLNRQVF